MPKRTRPSRAALASCAAIAVVAWSMAAFAWRATGQVGLALSLFGLGVSLGPCLASYTLAGPRRKQAWRQVVLASGGLAILAFALLDAVDLDLEGCLALLFAGTMGVAVGHTVVTTVVGPLVFGRLLCGWGCWRAMVLEHLPVGAPQGRPAAWWSRMPAVGLALSVTAAGVSAVALHGRPGSRAFSLRGESVVPVAVGVAVYYAVSIGLGFALRDRRAFCKYVCPSGWILRWTSRHALLAVRSSAEACSACGACSRVCPMDVPVAARARIGGRVADGECILCQRCVTACPTGALQTGVRLTGSPRH